MRKAVILGLYIENDRRNYNLTKSADSLNKKWSNELRNKIDLLGPIFKGRERTFFGLSPDYLVVTVVGLGGADAGVNNDEQIDEKKENIRLAVALGFKAIDKLEADIDVIDVDSCGDPLSAAEGIHLAAYKFNELKKKDIKNKRALEFNLLDEDSESKLKWERGIILSKGQNIVRRFTEMPANLMTPRIFANEVMELLKGTKIELFVRDENWVRSKGMGLLLSVAQGSDQPLVFLELHYKNLPGNSNPMVLVGKGVTFDSGGISLKPSFNMSLMKADMMGGAIVVSTIYTLEKLGAAVNVIGLVPLTENLLCGRATKPGDVFTAMNGKRVQVDNTDAEGRLILADALCYSSEFNPSAVIDIATLTSATDITFGEYVYGAWCTKDYLWNLIQQTSIDTGELVWRMPLFKHYAKIINEKTVADLNNIGDSKGASNIAAAFLHEFVTCPNWAHLDIASVDVVNSGGPYMPSGFSGKPLRSLTQVVERFFK